ncbi:MAG: hypothetical protein JO064_11790 [Actinobacteria bacterium]|nr:hypothetical protein [Actinomycetota bacterium]
MTYLDELARELRAVGIRGLRGRRIVAELADHLACDPDADLGSPRALAQQFADELATRSTRRGAFAAFGGLAVAGIAYTVAFAEAGRLHDSLATVVAILAPQVAFVAGTLAVLRAARLRGLALPAAEARVIRRRTTVALGAGLATMAAVIALGHTVVGAIGLAALIAATPLVFRGVRVRSTAAGAAGDLFADLGPLVPAPLTGRPWRLALVVAAAVGAAVTLAGVVQSDPFDGALRGLADGTAVLAGFALLGRYLGLRAQ